MNLPQFFSRVAELSDDATLASLIVGKIAVTINHVDYEPKIVSNRLVLIGDDGLDREFSDLNMITQVKWLKLPDLEIKPLTPKINFPK